MSTLLQADVFFFIAALGTVALSFLGAIALWYLIKVLRSAHELLEVLKKEGGAIGGKAEHLLQRVEESMVFNFLFKQRKQHGHLTKNSKRS